MQPKAEPSSPDTATNIIPLREPTERPAGTKFSAPENFLNRELSWLEFNKRVLEEAQDATVPLLERLKFLAIFASNLDEFFMVRVGGLQQKVTAGVPQGSGADRMSPHMQLEKIEVSVRE